MLHNTSPCADPPLLVSPPVNATPSQCHVCKATTPILLNLEHHLVHKVTSSQVFKDLMLLNCVVKRQNYTLITIDSKVPTKDLTKPSSVETIYWK